jgi:hypothetical protein
MLQIQRALLEMYGIVFYGDEGLTIEDVAV